jgi:UDP-2-acetamido-2,6-beta-L-arabino-hexul-4-ose reductase
LKILITGADGFIGRNLRAQLESEGEHRIFLSTRETSERELQEVLDVVDGIIHLAGVMRPNDKNDYHKENTLYTNDIVDYLSSIENNPFIIFASSIQVLMDNDYGRSKLSAENLLLNYSKSKYADVAIFRFPNIFGKWCKPNYNSVVSTFCYNIHRDLEIWISDETNIIPLLYIDDAIKLISKSIETKCKEQYPDIKPIYEISLGNLAQKIKSYKTLEKKNVIPNFNSLFDRYLFTTYMSFKEIESLSYPLISISTSNSKFIELIRNDFYGQVSLNIIESGEIRGNHWHQTKHERFIVIKGSAIVRLREKGQNEIYEFNLSDEHIEVIEIPPGMVHNIENIGSDELYTIMWANEPFDSNYPDTYPEEV